MNFASSPSFIQRKGILHNNLSKSFSSFWKELTENILNKITFLFLLNLTVFPDEGILSIQIALLRDNDSLKTYFPENEKISPSKLTSLGVFDESFSQMLVGSEI